MFTAIQLTRGVARVNINNHSQLISMATNRFVTGRSSSTHPTYHSAEPAKCDRLIPELPLDVSHDVKGNEFYIQLTKDAKVADSKAYLQYSYINPRHLDLEHTVVPYEYRGQGIAKILAQAAFDFCVKKDFDMRLTCTYLQKFHEDDPQPQYTKHIKEDNQSVL